MGLGKSGRTNHAAWPSVETRTARFGGFGQGCDNRPVTDTPPDARPIAWLALQEGASVYAADGSEVGKVGRVVADEQKDIFSGLTLRSGLFAQERFVPADAVEEITEAGVRLRLAEADAGGLEPYEG